jgi:hypothetical protein
MRHYSCEIAKSGEGFRTASAVHHIKEQRKRNKKRLAFIALQSLLYAAVAAAHS